MQRVIVKNHRDGRWLAAAIMVGGQVLSGAAVADTVTHRVEGKVIRVVDGDTLRLQAEGRRFYTIRLASIDAPETGKRDQPGQAYGNAARRALTDLAEGRTLRGDCYEIDNYDRHICDLKLADGKSVNRRMVELGFAWANREKRGKFLRDPAMLPLEQTARHERRGLWRQRDQVAPWQWRYDCWRQHQCD